MWVNLDYDQYSLVVGGGCLMIDVSGGGST